MGQTLWLNINRHLKFPAWIAIQYAPFAVYRRLKLRADNFLSRLGSRKCIGLSVSTHILLRWKYEAWHDLSKLYCCGKKWDVSSTLCNFNSLAVRSSDRPRTEMLRSVCGTVRWYIFQRFRNFSKQKYLIQHLYNNNRLKFTVSKTIIAAISHLVNNYVLLVFTCLFLRTKSYFYIKSVIMSVPIIIIKIFILVEKLNFVYNLYTYTFINCEEKYLRRKFTISYGWQVLVCFFHVCITGII